MPKTGKPYLFELVQSLSKSEKRYCTLFLDRNGSGKETGLQILFNVLDSLESYDEIALLDSLPELDRRRLPNSKRRLYDRLLQALRLYYAGSNAATVIREHLQSAEILYNKGHFEACWKLLEKCKSLAYDNELIHMLPEIINWQKRRLILRIRSLDSRAAYRAMVDEEQCVSKILLNTLAAEELNSRVYAVFIKNGRVIRVREKLADELEALHGELLEREAKYLDGKTSFWEGVYISSAANQYFQMTGEFERAYTHTVKKLESFDSKPFMPRDEPVMYSYALNNCIICQIVLGKYDEAEQLMHRLREFGRNASESPDAPSSVSVFETVNFLELEMHIRRGHFDEALRVVAELMPVLNSYDKSIHSVNVFSKYYRIALAWFGSGDYTQSLEWVHEVCNAGELVSRADIYVSVRMLNLLIQFELKQYELLEYLADSYRRDLLRLERLYASEDVFLQFMRRTPHFRSRSELHAGLEQLLSKLLALRVENRLDRYAFAYFNLCDWIKTQLKGTSYSEVIKKKSRLEADENTCI